MMNKLFKYAPFGMILIASIGALQSFSQGNYLATLWAIVAALIAFNYSMFWMEIVSED